MANARRVLIRAAELNEAVRLAEVIRAAFESYRGNLVPPTGAHDESDETVRRKLSDATALVAEVDGEIVGVVFVKWLCDGAYFDRLAVLPVFRRAGVGSALIADVERHSADRGLPRVTLRARLSQPHNMVFFESLGYRVFATRPHPDTGEETYALLEKEIAGRAAV